MKCTNCGHDARPVWWEDEQQGGAQNPIEGVGYCDLCDLLFTVTEIDRTDLTSLTRKRKKIDE